MEGFKYELPAFSQATTTKVTIFSMSGAKLAACDVGGTSDPYVKLCVCEKSKANDAVKAPKKGASAALYGKTSTKKKTLCPRWNEIFHFEIKGPIDQYVLRLDVWDKDAIGSDDFMGRTCVSFVDQLTEKLDSCKDKGWQVFQKGLHDLKTEVPLTSRDGKKGAEKYGKLSIAFSLQISDIEEKTKDFEKCEKEEQERAAEEKRKQEEERKAKLAQYVSSAWPEVEKTLNNLSEEDKASFDVSTLKPSDAPDETTANFLMDAKIGDIISSLNQALESELSKDDNKESVLVTSAINLLADVASRADSDKLSCFTNDLIEKLMKWNEEYEPFLRLAKALQGKVGYQLSPHVSTFVSKKIWALGDHTAKNFIELKKMINDPPQFTSMIDRNVISLRREFLKSTKLHPEHIEAIKMVGQVLFTYDKFCAESTRRGGEDRPHIAWYKLGVLFHELATDKTGKKDQEIVQEYCKSAEAYRIVNGVGRNIQYMKMLGADNRNVRALGDTYKAAFPSTQTLSFPKQSLFF